MNGDAKSPQHTVVHPMYVSYTSIPTSASGTMLSNKHQNHTLNHHQHNHHPNHQQNTLSNSNNHLNNSTHAISTTTSTTPITTTITTNNNNNNSCNTPIATKKKFSSSSLVNNTQQQQQTSLHKQILTANATTTNNYNNNININSNSISHRQSHSRSNSNRNSSNSNQYNNNISNNSNTFLIHSHTSNSRGRGGTADISYNGSLLSNTSQYQPYNSGGSRRNRQRHNMSPSLSTASNSLTQILYSPKQGRKVQPSSSNSIFPANIDLAQKQQIIPAYYDDSTAKADHQLYVNGSRRQILIAQSPNQDTTPSLSYASLQNSTQNLNSSFKQNATPTPSPSNALSSSLSNSNYSLTNSLNNNQMAAVSGASGSGTSGHFARIHSKPKPAKSSSYSSFKHSASTSNQPPNQMSCNENSARSNTSQDQQPEFEECFEDDNFSVQNLKTDEGVTYIPFNKPTPGNYFLTPPPPPPPSSSSHAENNNKPKTLSSLSSQNSLNNNSQHQPFVPNSISPNNNTTPHTYHDNSGILLEHGAILQPLTPHELNPAQRALMYQQNGLPFHPAYSPVPYRQNSACSAQKPTPRPTNIPLPKIPDNYQTEFLSPSEVTPPPPPLPRPHIFQPRTGTAPYPDLSPEVTERYAMPTQYIPRSPVATRIARRQRQQNASNERSHGPLNSSANYCDQIRDTTTGYGPDNMGVNTYTISKARSYDRLHSGHSANGSFKDNKRNIKTKTEELTSPPPNSPLSRDMAPHVNRRSGRRDGQKARPRSYCNSMTGGEGVIRGNIALDRKVGYAN